MLLSLLIFLMLVLLLSLLPLVRIGSAHKLCSHGLSAIGFEPIHWTLTNALIQRNWALRPVANCDDGG